LGKVGPRLKKVGCFYEKISLIGALFAINIRYSGIFFVVLKLCFLGRNWGPFWLAIKWLPFG
jgi:hypothetical protein